MKVWDSIWNFLLNSKYLNATTIIITLFALFVAAAWKVYVHFSNRSSLKPSLSAKNGITVGQGFNVGEKSIIVGRDLIINEALTSKEQEETFKKVEEEINEQPLSESESSKIKSNLKEESKRHLKNREKENKLKKKPMEGTAFFVIGFPQPWPIKQENILFSKKNNETKISTVGYPDGHLRVKIERGKKEKMHFDTQKIKVIGNGFAILSIVWKESVISVYINGGKKLKPFDGDNPETRIVETKEITSQKKLSFQLPEANNCCKKWIDWRREKFDIPYQVAEENRRLKTEEEEIEQLKNAIISLRDLINFVKIGESHFLGNIAVTLKTLVYWQEGLDSNSLLLRLAGRKGLPLPVFALPHFKDQKPEILKQANYLYDNFQLSIQKKILTQELMDFQDWLKSDIQIERSMEGVPKNRVIMAKEVIFESANALGISSEDEDIAQAWDQLRESKMMGIDLLSRFLISTAEVTVALGIFVIEQYEKSKGS